MHLQTLGWARLSRQRRDEKLGALGIAPETLSEIRTLEPRERIIQAAEVALAIDEEPNSDFIEYIAGYKARAGLYHYFRDMDELLELAKAGHHTAELKPIELNPAELDLAIFIPSSFQNYAVHAEELRGAEKIVIWQKLNGGMRSVVINRRVPRILFWSGVLLYVTEGTKFSKTSSQVQIANARPGVIRLFLAFLVEVGVSQERVRARIHLHDITDRKRAQAYWDAEIGMSHNQYYKPMISKSRGIARRTTFTLHLQYNNSMLCALLSYWGDNLEKLKDQLGHL